MQAATISCFSLYPPALESFVMSGVTVDIAKEREKDEIEKQKEREKEKRKLKKKN